MCSLGHRHESFFTHLVLLQKMLLDVTDGLKAGLAVETGESFGRGGGQRVRGWPELFRSVEGIGARTVNGENVEIQLKGAGHGQATTSSIVW